MATLVDSISKALPPFLQNPDTQFAIFGFLCFIGAWVVITKLIQLVFSIIWPLMVIASFFIMAPNFSTAWFTEVMPQYAEAAVDWVRKQTDEFAARREQLELK